MQVHSHNKINRISWTLLNFNNSLSVENKNITEPPVGALRFRNPVPHRGWSGVRDASNHGNTCPSAGW